MGVGRREQDAIAATSLAASVWFVPTPEWGEHHSGGGCHPTDTHAARAETSGDRLRWSATTVARPVGVRPKTRVPSADQEKCSCQCCNRG